MRVDLPAPFSPRQRKNLARLHMEAHAFERAGASELFRHRMHGQQCVRYLFWVADHARLLSQALQQIS